MDEQNAQGSSFVKYLIWLLVLVAVVWGFASLSSRAKDDDGPVTIGFIGPLTGDAANIGENAQAAVEIAVAEVNEAGGIGGRELRVIYEDGKCNGKDASSAANKLINIDKVPVILGGACSGETSAFTGAAEQSKTVVLSYCSSAPAITDAGDYIFRNYPSDTYQGAFASEYIADTLGKTKVAVLYAKSDWGTGIKDVFAREFQERGGSIVAEEGYEQTSRDVRSNLTKIKSANPEVVYFLGYTEASIPGIKQAKELGITVPLFGGDAWDNSKIWSEVGNAGEGAMYSVVSSMPSESFKTAMREKVGSDEVAACSPTAYDGVKLLARVFGEVGTDPETVKNELYNTVYTGGVSSNEIRFDENGDLVGASYVVKRVEAGEAVEIKAEGDAEMSGDAVESGQ